MSTEEKIFLNVPFDEKDLVKRLGAKWDGKERGWWIGLHRDRDEFRPWLPRKYSPDIVPPFILPEMIPASSWYVNLRSLLPKEQWDRLRRDCYDRAGKRCQVCGGRGNKWPVECDEHWQYAEDPGIPGVGIQKLARLVALCPPCHWIKHLGKANIDGHYEQALQHLAFVNDWSFEQANSVGNHAFDVWERRSAMAWHLDLSILPDLGIAEIRINAAGLDALPVIVGVKVVDLTGTAAAFNAASAG